MKVLLRVAAIVAAVLAIVVLGYAINAALGMRAHARYTGTISGLRLHGPVSILRDDRGVPHILAADDRDLFFAQGYVEGVRPALPNGPAATFHPRRARRSLWRRSAAHRRSGTRHSDSRHRRGTVGAARSPDPRASWARSATASTQRCGASRCRLSFASSPTDRNRGRRRIRLRLGWPTYSISSTIGTPSQPRNAALPAWRLAAADANAFRSPILATTRPLPPVCAGWPRATAVTVAD